MNPVVETDITYNGVHLENLCTQDMLHLANKLEINVDGFASDRKSLIALIDNNFIRRKNKHIIDPYDSFIENIVSRLLASTIPIDSGGTTDENVSAIISNSDLSCGNRIRYIDRTIWIEIIENTNQTVTDNESAIHVEDKQFVDDTTMNNISQDISQQLCETMSQNAKKSDIEGGLDEKSVNDDLNLVINYESDESINKQQPEGHDAIFSCISYSTEGENASSDLITQLKSTESQIDCIPAIKNVDSVHIPSPLLSSSYPDSISQPDNMLKMEESNMKREREDSIDLDMMKPDETPTEHPVVISINQQKSSSPLLSPFTKSAVISESPLYVGMKSSCVGDELIANDGDALPSCWDQWDDSHKRVYMELHNRGDVVRCLRLERRMKTSLKWHEREREMKMLQTIDAAPAGKCNDSAVISTCSCEDRNVRDVGIQDVGIQDVGIQDVEIQEVVKKEEKTESFLNEEETHSEIMVGNEGENDDVTMKWSFNSRNEWDLKEKKEKKEKEKKKNHITHSLRLPRILSSHSQSSSSIWSRLFKSKRSDSVEKLTDSTSKSNPSIWSRLFGRKKETVEKCVKNETKMKNEPSFFDVRSCNFVPMLPCCDTMKGDDEMESHPYSSPVNFWEKNDNVKVDPIKKQEEIKSLCRSPKDEKKIQAFSAYLRDLSTGKISSPIMNGSLQPDYSVSHDEIMRNVAYPALNREKIDTAFTPVTFYKRMDEMNKRERKFSEENMLKVWRNGYNQRVGRDWTDKEDENGQNYHRVG